MARQLYFNGMQIGDWFLRGIPASPLLTPPVSHVGLYQPIANVVSDSKNLQFAIQFYVAITQYGTNPELLKAITDIQQLAGEFGDIEIKDGAEVELLCANWVIVDVPPPELPFGGRFCPELIIMAQGSTPPEA